MSNEWTIDKDRRQFNFKVGDKVYLSDRSCEKYIEIKAIGKNTFYGKTNFDSSTTLHDKDLDWKLFQESKTISEETPKLKCAKIQDADLINILKHRLERMDGKTLEIFANSIIGIDETNGYVHSTCDGTTFTISEKRPDSLKLYLRGEDLNDFEIK